MLKVFASSEPGLTFDLISTGSVGALNGALIAAGLSPLELGRLLRAVSR